MAPGNKRTPERLALLRQLCADSEAWPVILLRINAEPGPPIASLVALRVWASEAGIRRASKPAPPPVRQAPVVAQPTSFPLPPLMRTPGQRAYARAMTPPAERPDLTTPIVADMDTLRGVAGRWGLPFNGRDDLAELNAKAARIGHRPFALEQPARSRVA